MADVLVMVAALAAVPILLRIGFGGLGGGRSTIRLKVREPMRSRHPGLWWSGVLLGLMALAVLWLANSCGWTR